MARRLFRRRRTTTSYKARTNKPKRKKRTQKVRFRRRYAASMAKRTAVGVWNLFRLGLFAFIISWSTLALWNFWKTSPSIRIKSVEYKGYIPSGLREHLELKPGQNIFFFRPSKLSAKALDAYADLKALKVGRRFDRTVVVRGVPRVPVAIYGKRDQRAMDDQGVVFPLRFETETPLPRVVKVSNSDTRAHVAESLTLLRQKNPEFYARLKTIKTDKINNVMMTLTDDVSIHWGEFRPETALLKSQRIETLLTRFNPKNKKATLRFVESNRVIMDSNWKEAQQKGGRP